MQTAKLSLIAALFAVFAFVFVGKNAEAQSTAEQEPSMSEIVEAAMQGLDADPVIKYEAAGSTTAEDLIDTDLSATEQTNRYVQNFFITNLSASVNLCVYTVGWDEACTDTAHACVAAGSGDQAMLVPAGKMRELRFTGEVRVCGMSDAASGVWQAERQVKPVGER